MVLSFASMERKVNQKDHWAVFNNVMAAPFNKVFFFKGKMEGIIYK